MRPTGFELGLELMFQLPASRKAPRMLQLHGDSRPIWHPCREQVPSRAACSGCAMQSEQVPSRAACSGCAMQSEQVPSRAACSGCAMQSE
eukprot:CAMPEP_0115879712 /NCGR_PEP_ID=MMETSP0287-20121206/27472_1 /TAXON_ID=412157 /ORGANISM="Chrysochromulina rotalis, Strain UIO044" /LENGTH=89 /DNA_ID=CAMNT_0003335451 /DNA_START=556 /DNA_END=822 /DNA_ORIENTATION=+